MWRGFCCSAWAEAFGPADGSEGRWRRASAAGGRATPGPAPGRLGPHRGRHRRDDRGLQSRRGGRKWSVGCRIGIAGPIEQHTAHRNQQGEQGDGAAGQPAEALPDFGGELVDAGSSDSGAISGGSCGIRGERGQRSGRRFPARTGRLAFLVRLGWACTGHGGKSRGEKDRLARWCGLLGQGRGYGGRGVASERAAKAIPMESGRIGRDCSWGQLTSAGFGRAGAVRREPEDFHQTIAATSKTGDLAGADNRTGERSGGRA